MRKVTRVVCFIGLAFIGMAFLVAASTVENGDLQTRMAGMLLGSLGSIMASTALYVDARSMNAKRTAQKRKSTVVCPSCRTEPATFWCVRHSESMCADCLVEHHTPNTCLYRPLITPTSSARA